jgi:hypothetical protein
VAGAGTLERGLWMVRVVVDASARLST